MHIFWGKVQKGDKRGRELGYPTANMRLHRRIEEGVYMSVIYSLSLRLDGKSKWLPALTFIGSAKTFGKKDYKAETWILDFNRNLYGRFLTVKLLKKLRGNIRFENAEGLIEQMKNDEIAAREYFLSH